MKERQYGEWLRAGGVVRSGNEKRKGLDGGSSDGVDGDWTSFKLRGTAANFSSSAFSRDDVDGGRNSSNELVVKKAVNFETLTRDSNSNLSVGDSLNGWDKAKGTARGLQFGQEAVARLKENETKISLVGGLFKLSEDAMSATTFKNVGHCSEEPEVSSPIKAKKEALKECHPNGMGLSSKVEKESISRGKWKKIAREKGKAQDEEMVLKGPEVGNKRTECIKDLIEVEGRVQKKVCGGESYNKSSYFLNETTMTARQHR